MIHISEGMALHIFRGGEKVIRVSVNEDRGRGQFAGNCDRMALTAIGGRMNRRGKLLGYVAILSLIGVGGIFAIAGAAYAAGSPQTIDVFWVCDGQTGVALGLCNGAVASQCSGEKAGTDICLAIEERYRKLTGRGDVPWVYAYYPVQSYTASGGSVDLETGIQCLDPNNVNPPMCIGDIEVGFDGTEPPPFPNPWRFVVAGACPSHEQGVTVGVEYAFLDGVPFSEVLPQSIDSAVFTLPAPNEWEFLPVFDVGDTAIVHTCAGNYFKVGLFTCNVLDSPWTQCNDTGLPNMTMRFYYQLLRPAQ